MIAGSLRTLCRRGNGWLRSDDRWRPGAIGCETVTHLVRSAAWKGECPVRLSRARRRPTGREHRKVLLKTDDHRCRRRRDSAARPSDRIDRTSGDRKPVGAGSGDRHCPGHHAAPAPPSSAQRSIAHHAVTLGRGGGDDMAAPERRPSASSLLRTYGLAAGRHRRELVDPSRAPPHDLTKPRSAAPRPHMLCETGSVHEGHGYGFSRRREEGSAGRAARRAASGRQPAETARASGAATGL